MECYDRVRIRGFLGLGSAVCSGWLFVKISDVSELALSISHCLDF